VLEMSEVIAVDLGGTNLRVALVKNNSIVKIIKKKTPKNGKLLIKEIEDSISSLFNKRIKGIGLAVPGPVFNGVLKNPPNLKVRNFNFKKYLQKKFKVRIEIDNDANCVALAELLLGYKKKNFFIITLGTGVGGGIVINGKVYSGQGYGGELGHIILNNKKDFEYYWKKYRGKILIKDMIKSSKKEHQETLKKLIEYISQGIASLINIFDPEIVVFAGGAKEAGEYFLNLIRKNTEKYVFLPKKYKIKWTKLNEPGILGASLLIR